MDVETGAIVARGRSMPHSPHLYRGRRWVLESGRARRCPTRPGRSPMRRLPKSGTDGRQPQRRSTPPPPVEAPGRMSDIAPSGLETCGYRLSPDDGRVPPDVRDGRVGMWLAAAPAWRAPRSRPRSRGRAAARMPGPWMVGLLSALLGFLGSVRGRRRLAQSAGLSCPRPGAGPPRRGVLDPAHGSGAGTAGIIVRGRPSRRLATIRRSFA